MSRVPLQHDGGNWYPGYKHPTIRKDIAREAYQEYSDQGHGDQSFERLHERGGFGCRELAMLLFQRIHRLQGKEVPRWEV